MELHMKPQITIDLANAQDGLPICRDHWKPLTQPFPKDRYILLFSPGAPDWDGNMEVGQLWGDCFWSCGGPNGGLELDPEGTISHHDNAFTHWRDLPEAPPPPPKNEFPWHTMWRGYPRNKP